MPATRSMHIVRPCVDLHRIHQRTAHSLAPGLWTQEHRVFSALRISGTGSEGSVGRISDNIATDIGNQKGRTTCLNFHGNALDAAQIGGEGRKSIPNYRVQDHSNRRCVFNSGRPNVHSNTRTPCGVSNSARNAAGPSSNTTCSNSPKFLTKTGASGWHTIRRRNRQPLSGNIRAGCITPSH